MEFADFFFKWFSICFKSWFMDAISSRTEEGAADAGEGLGTGLPWPEGAELSARHAWAGRTRVRSLQGGYFQPLRNADEATLQKK